MIGKFDELQSITSSIRGSAGALSEYSDILLNIASSGEVSENNLTMIRNINIRVDDNTRFIFKELAAMVSSKDRVVIE